MPRHLDRKTLTKSVIAAAPEPLDLPEDSDTLDPQDAITTAYEWHGGGGSALYAFASNGGHVEDEAQRQKLLSEIEECMAYVNTNKGSIDSGSFPEFSEDTEDAQAEGVSTSDRQIERIQNLKNMAQKAEITVQASLKQAAEWKPNATHSDEDAAKEDLNLFLYNTSSLHSQHEAIVKNLSKKLTKGVYDPNLAWRLWLYWVDSGAQAYAKENPGAPWYQTFPKSTRMSLAKEIAADEEQQIKNGEYDATPKPPAAAQPTGQPQEAMAPVTGSADKEAKTLISEDVFRQALKECNQLLSQVGGTNSIEEGKLTKIQHELMKIDAESGGDLAYMLDDETHMEKAKWAQQLIQALSFLKRTVAQPELAGVTGSTDKEADMMGDTVKSILNFARTNKARLQMLLHAQGPEAMVKEMVKAPGSNPNLNQRIVPALSQFVDGHADESTFAGMLASLLSGGKQQMASTEAAHLTMAALRCAGLEPSACRAAGMNVDVLGLNVNPHTLRIVAKVAGDYGLKLKLAPVAEKKAATYAPPGEQPDTFQEPPRDEPEGIQHTASYGDDDMGDDSSPECPMCGGPGNELGSLGPKRHFRCRNCGMDFSKTAGKVAADGTILGALAEMETLLTAVQELADKVTGQGRISGDTDLATVTERLNVKVYETLLAVRTAKAAVQAKPQAPAEVDGKAIVLAPVTGSWKKKADEVDPTNPKIHALRLTTNPDEPFELRVYTKGDPRPKEDRVKGHDALKQEVAKALAAPGTNKVEVLMDWGGQYALTDEWMRDPESEGFASEWDQRTASVKSNVVASEAPSAKTGWEARIFSSKKSIVASEDGQLPGLLLTTSLKHALTASTWPNLKKAVDLVLSENNSCKEFHNVKVDTGTWERKTKTPSEMFAAIKDWSKQAATDKEAIGAWGGEGYFTRQHLPSAAKPTADRYAPMDMTSVTDEELAALKSRSDEKARMWENEKADFGKDGQLPPKSIQPSSVTGAEGDNPFPTSRRTTKCVDCGTSGDPEKMKNNEDGAGYLCSDCNTKRGKTAAPATGPVWAGPDEAKQWLDTIKAGVQAPFVNGYISTLGGPANASVMMTISSDPKESWSNGILENSNYAKLMISNAGVLETISGNTPSGGLRSNMFRKTRVTSPEQAITKLNTLVSVLKGTGSAAPITAPVTAPITSAQLTKGPDASKGDTISNAIEYINANAKDMEDYTVQQLREALTGSGYTQQVVDAAVVDLLGQEALQALASPVKSLLGS